MRALVVIGVIGGLLLAGCSAERNQATAHAPTRLSQAVRSALRTEEPRLTRSWSEAASLPDRGNFLAYDKTGTREQGAYAWHAVSLSEEHALRAIEHGGMVIPTPNGKPIRLTYVRSVEHPDGSWSWIGRPVGARPGAEAILTFGAKAVFGSIPNGKEEPLQLTTAGGRTWLVETDRRIQAAAASHAAQPETNDFIVPPAALRRASSVGATAVAPKAAAAMPVARAATPASTAIVDLVIGYTSTFASRLGGTSQAMTRLNFLVDTANQAYANSQVNGQLRLVKAVQVDYPDDTANRTALFELSGVTCSSSANPDLHLPEGGVACDPADRPAALQPLIDARDEIGADLVVLVRNFFSTENGSCGVGWVLGGGQTPLDASSADFGLSVISDSNGNQFPSNSSTCRNDTLAHETGHNMGLQHDRASAGGNDDTNNDGNLLDPDEFGHFTYSFGFSTDASGGNFYTVMAQRVTGQTGYLVFSNPRITFCGGLSCGITDQADNARTLEQTMPIVAAFRTPHLVRNDFNGDGISDILWRNTSSGLNAIWLSANASTPQPISGVTNLAWKVVGAGDFDADGRSDILWRNTSNGYNAIWNSGNGATQTTVARVANLAWAVAGVGDVNGDGKADIVWRNTSNGLDAVWLSGDSATPQFMYGVTDQNWKIVGVGDFDADGQSDVLWRNVATGRNVVWKSADRASQQGVTAVTNLAWAVAGVGDFDGDGRSDILWRNNSTGLNAIWLSANSATPMPIASVTDLSWHIVAVADYDGDGRSDILWRNTSTGVDVIWLSGNRSTPHAVQAVTSSAWTVVAG